ncbi:hypothetical protein BKP56_09300 [Marinilactibacillus sp. 15R]|uniref:hypothetical protein n=1 Tax=Marinilactibacillus sp. 15R TaxID=1911586 RepID=UPI0009094A25|nr:hypothetical protein [Marinilactibacillus sp. 15R]API89437.1 hypothetical protein BKP56_09300 [Marinilactibacillus sp. 15R]
MKQIIKHYPGWNINTILETDVLYLDEIMLSTGESEGSQQGQTNQSRKVISMEDWFNEMDF